MGNQEGAPGVQRVILEKMQLLLQDIEKLDSPDHAKRLETLKALTKTLDALEYIDDEDD